MQKFESHRLIANRKPAKKMQPESPSIPQPGITPQQRENISFALARSLERQRKLEEAKRMYHQIAVKDPRNAPVQHRLAVIADKQNDAASADFYKAALSLDGANVELLCDYGYSLYLHGNYDAAEQHLKRATQLAPRHRRARNNYGVLLARTARLDAAALEFQRAGCTPAEAKLNLAFALTLDEKWEAARDQYRHALELDPASKPARDGLARLDHMQRQFASASESSNVPAVASPPVVNSLVEVASRPTMIPHPPIASPPIVTPVEYNEIIDEVIVAEFPEQSP